MACQVFLFSGLTAQIENKLTMPVVQAGAGSEAGVPVYLNNDQELVAVQFTLRFPAGFSLSDTTRIELTDRKANHTVSVKKLANNEFLFVVFSANNTPLRGNTGVLLHIPVLVPDTCTDGTMHPFVFTQQILSSRTGQNILTSSTPGAIEIIVKPRPDLVVDNVSLSTQQAAPGDKITISWKVSNTGNLSTASGWSEQVTLVAPNGETASLGTVFQNQLLGVGEFMLRQTEFMLAQAPGIDGPVNVQVRIIPNAKTGELPSAQQNNTALSAQQLNVSRMLTLKLNRNRIYENDGYWIQAQLTRSGSRAAGQAFAVSVDKPGRIEFPNEIIINAGSSGTVFYVRSINNQVLNTDTLLNITVAGVGYPNATDRLVIIDDEIPKLTLVASKQQLKEGDQFSLTLTRELVNEIALRVAIACDYPKRFDYPTTVIIPSGEASVQIPVSVINDQLPAPAIEAGFSADVVGFAKGRATVILDDDDVPVISLSLAPATVSESSGYQASIGTIRREGNTDNVLNVKLMDNSGGTLFYSQNIVSLEKGVREKKFSIGVVDNAIVDGTRTFDITAAVYMSACNCSMTGTGAGIVQQQITVLDDDGPALKISTSQTMLPEGKANATVLTVTRNTPPDQALAVTITSDKEPKLEYQRNLTIPAGSVTVSTPVSVKSDLISEGDQTVTFTVTADGFTRGFCWAMISDQTLADAVISIMTVSNENPETLDSLTVRVNITNIGVAPLNAGRGVDIFLNAQSRKNGSEKLLIHANTGKIIQPNQSDSMTLKFKLPDVTGVQYLLAEVNGEQTQKELSFLNNVSEGRIITLLPKYSVQLQTDKSVYQSGEKVTFSGKATLSNGNGVPDVPVEIYMINSGNRQTLPATTDAQGNFSLSFTPSPAQMGRFAAGACYPGEGLTTEKISFEVLGLRRTTSGHIIWEVLTGIPQSFEIEIMNPGTTTLTGITARMVTEHSGLTMTFDPITDLSGGQKIKVKATLNGTIATPVQEYEKINIELKSANGAVLDMLIYYFCRNPRATLKPDISSIQTTMTKGATRQFEFKVTNQGTGDSGPITVAIPKTAWLSMLTPVTLPSLKFGESTNVILQFAPGSDMAVNVPVTGNIGVNCQNGSGFSLPFNIETVSESTGTLVVDVCNEYTYYTSEAPHVAGATVKVRHPHTKVLLHQGVTNAAGLFTVENLKEGYYYLEVTAPKHDGYANNVLVDPGKITKQVVNLSFQSITISWDVVETEVEDEYNIETTVKFETNVPTPVVEMSFPREIDTEKMLVGESVIFNIVLTNKGLITAKDVEVTMPKHFSAFTFEPLFNVIDLKPQESVLIPVTLTKVGNPNPDNAPRRVGAADKDPCEDYIIVIYFWDCGLDRKWHQYPQKINLGKWCFGTTTYTGTGWTPDYGPGGPGGPGGGGYIPPSSNDYTPTIRVEDCEPCQNSFTWKMAKCFLKRVPFIEKILNITEKVLCAKDVFFFREFKCLIEGLVKSIPYVDVILGYKDLYEECLKPIIEPCKPGDFGLSNAPGLFAKQQAEFPAYTEHFRQVLIHVYNASNAGQDHMLEFFGDSAWLKVTGGELTPFFDKIWEYEVSIPADAALRSLKPVSISDALYEKFVQRVNNTIAQNFGSANFINKDTLNAITARKVAAMNFAQSLGYSSVEEMFIKEYEIWEKKNNESSGSVCATITIKFSQTMTLTRQAFRGTLTVFNGHESKAMEEVKLNLKITDETGAVAGTQLFQTNTESLDKLTEIDGTGKLNAQETGTAVILFIPTKNAAPEVPKEYSFGGALSYLDPFTNSVVTRDLFPVTLTVKPSPDLWLKYFMQRDVLGDNPLTKDVVEPSVDAEFSLLIHNKGAGEATNVKIASKQPEIVDNEKGLLITFEITGSSLNGAPKNMGITSIDFGNIPAGGASWGQWFIRSSLLGHFVEYDTKVTHVTSFGNPDLSLVSDVSIHELIRSIEVPKDNTLLRGFLANDVVDSDDYPDMLYLADGTFAEVGILAQHSLEAVDATTRRFRISPAKQGWTYANMADPGNGALELKEVVRESDGAIIPIRNVWQTDVTLRDGKDPLNEFRIHFADEVKQANESYLFRFEVRRDAAVDVVSITGAPSDVAVAAVQKLRVLFNRPVDVASFTTEDLQLNCQGVAQDVTAVVITQLTDREFELDLSSATAKNGYYVLTVQTAGITDTDGFTGKHGRMASWIQFLDGKVQLTINVLPAGSGTVTPETRQFDYGKAIKLTANPNEGYRFRNWTSGAQTLGGTREITHVPTENTTLNANFELMSYSVQVKFNAEQGLVTGNQTGIYVHGDQLYLTALPGKDYNFSGWRINGEMSETLPVLTLTVNNDLIIEAVFIIKDFSGIADLWDDSNRGMHLYPNPSRQDQGVVVILNMPEQDLQHSRIVVYSLTGAVERNIPVVERELKLNALQPGMYMICLFRNHELVVRQKAVIER